MFKTLLLSALLSYQVCAWADATETTPPRGAAMEHYEAAKKALANNQWKAALADLEKAARLEPGNPDIQNLLGYSYRKAGDLPKAFEHYGIALKLKPEHLGANEYIGRAYLMNNDLANAEKHLATLERLCQKTCSEYQSLAKAVADYKAGK